MGSKKKNRDLLIGGAIIAVFLLLGTFLNSARSMLVTAVAINILFGLSFSLLFAYTGMTSLGHAVFFGMGSYFMMIFILKCGINLWAAALLSIVATTILAVFFGAVCLRNGMQSFAFLSMGIGTTLAALFLKWSWIGSDIGLQANFLPEWLTDFRVRYYFIVIIVAICSVIFYLLTRSPFVSIAKGIRENDERLTFLGVNVQRQRLMIFVVSAFFASIAGVLYTFRSTGSYVAQLETGISQQAIMMCMVGGTETFFGPVLGAVVVTLFSNYVSGMTIYYQGFMGAFVLLTVYLIRDGLISKRVGSGIVHIYRKLAGKAAKAEK